MGQTGETSRRFSPLNKLRKLLPKRNSHAKTKVTSNADLSIGQSSDSSKSEECCPYPTHICTGSIPSVDSSKGRNPHNSIADALFHHKPSHKHSSHQKHHHHKHHIFHFGLHRSRSNDDDDFSYGTSSQQNCEMDESIISDFTDIEFEVLKKMTEEREEKMFRRADRIIEYEKKISKIASTRFSKDVSHCQIGLLSDSSVSTMWIDKHEDADMDFSIYSEDYLHSGPPSLADCAEALDSMLGPRPLGDDDSNASDVCNEQHDYGS